MKRSKKCVFLAHCLLAQTVRANGLARYSPGPVKPVVQFCLDHDINMIQMPCPEVLCTAGGVLREPHGKAWYEERGLRNACSKLSEEQAAYAKTLVEAGNEILAIIGMEFSPACATTYLNKGRTIRKGRGIFIEELQKELDKLELRIPFIGVNQRWLKKLEKSLQSLLEHSAT